METIAFNIQIYDKGINSLRSKNGYLVGKTLSKEIKYYDSNNEIESLSKREAYRIIECFEVINKDIKIEIDIRYYDTISSTWASLSTIRNF